MKIFTNQALEINDEKPIKKGSVVPEGAVSLGWYSAPDLTPENSSLLIDTSRSLEQDNSKLSLGYANLLGILEDESGNQAWPEEYPIVSDEFLDSDRPLVNSDILPYAHVSRFLHIDSYDMAFSGSLTEFSPTSNLKVVNSKGEEYSDINGLKYKIFGVKAPIEDNIGSRTGLYRIWVFLDTDPDVDELYLIYNKVEYDNTTSNYKNQFIGFKEPINATAYYENILEESEVLDQGSSKRKIFATKPIDYKDQIVGRAQPSYKGWQIQVPKKAIPDPRKFELFRWRLACEYSRSVDPNETSKFADPTPLRVGIVTFNQSGSIQSRANFIFPQLNESSYNTGGISFVNPISEQAGLTDKLKAKYWHVPIQSIAINDLEQFDVLIWAPSSKKVVLNGSIIPKINYFTETLGRTFIFETSSRCVFEGLDGVSFGQAKNTLNQLTSDSLTVSDNAYFEYQSATPNSTTSGSYGSWPPNTENFFTDNSHSSEVLKKLNFLGGWDLDSTNELIPSSLSNLSNVNNLYFQPITEYGSEWEPITDSKKNNNSTRFPTLIRKKTAAGGNIYVSTSCIFEDHTLTPEGVVKSYTTQVPSVNSMSTQARQEFFLDADSTIMEGENKLRINILMLSTAFRPSTNLSNSPTTGFNQDFERHTVTLYSDWNSSWVINAHNDVLSAEEKARFNFSLLPKTPEDQDPVWMRFLSTKTAGQIMAEKIDSIQSEQLNKTFQNLNGLNKRYSIIITNQNVETFASNLISDNTVPAAWTYTFSPSFNVPYELGNYAIREEMIPGIGVGEGKRVYPRRSFKLRTSASYITNGVSPHAIKIKVKLKGTAKRIYSIPETKRLRLPSSNALTYIGERATVGATADRKYGNFTVAFWSDYQLRCLKDNDPVMSTPNEIWTGGGKNDFTDREHLTNIPHPHGVTTWSDQNYNLAGGRATSYGNWAMHGRYAHGSRGDVIRVIQKLLNHYIYIRGIGGPFLAEDGIFGDKTRATVLDLQLTKGANFQDGVVDSETFALLGYIMASFFASKDWRNRTDKESYRLAQTANRYLRMDHMTRSQDYEFGHMRQGPSKFYKPGPLRESFLLTFLPEYSINANDDGFFDMHELVVQPYFFSYDKSKTAKLDWLDVGFGSRDKNGWREFRGYDFKDASHGKMNVSLYDGKYTSVPFRSTSSLQVVFRIVKEGNSGGIWGTQKMMGIKDAYVIGKKKRYKTPPPPDPQPEVVIEPGQTAFETLQIEATQEMTLKTGIPKKASMLMTNGTFLNNVKITTIDPVSEDFKESPNHITEVEWDSFSIIPSSKASEIDVDPIDIKIGNEITAKTFRFTYNNAVTSNSDPNYSFSKSIGDGNESFWVKNLQGRVEPYARKYGWVSKDQGVLLICNRNGTPKGFPNFLPSRSAIEQNFTRLIMDAWDNDQTVYYGFYDVKENEWVENSNGEPNISFYDYMRRGPENVYMAVQTTYEIDTQSNLPAPDEPVMRPFKIAMPIYGVKTRNEGNIKLQNPFSQLGRKDVWPVSVGTGSFVKQFKVKQEVANKSTNFLRDYSGKTLSLYYSLREGVRGPWSELLGRPFKDAYNEQPELLSDKTFKVSKFPIASVQEPTLKPGLYDPITPLFTVYKRISLGSPWVKLGQEEIKEYDLNKGIITLNTPLLENDSRLIKVDYTFRDYSYHLTHVGDKKINLNPYVLNKFKNDDTHLDVLNKALYVYVLPSFVVDNETQEVITSTHEENILKVTTDKSIFDYNQAEYNPLAYQLGIIFTMSTSDLRQLQIIDTRVRGGGAKHHLKASETDVENDFASYWDATSEKGYSYQKGGFVIIRLPVEVKEDFATEEELRKVIDRNITSGVVYKIQDYSGQPLFGN